MVQKCNRCSTLQDGADHSIIILCLKKLGNRAFIREVSVCADASVQLFGYRKISKAAELMKTDIQVLLAVREHNMACGL